MYKYLALTWSVQLKWFNLPLLKQLTKLLNFDLFLKIALNKQLGVRKSKFEGK